MDKQNFFKVDKIKPYYKYDWKEHHNKFIKENFHSHSANDFAKLFNVKRTTMRTHMYSLGLYKMRLQYWNDVQVKFLIDNYKEIGDTELAEIFNVKWHKDKGWTKKHIEKKRRYLKLKRTKAETRKVHKRNLLMGRFKMCPVNAWITRGGAAPELERRVWYKENDSPLVVIKIGNRFIHYAPWLWRKERGPIPKGKMVRIMSDDKVNFTIDDLILVTRSEHAAMNSKNRYPAELKEVIKLTKKLHKLINKNDINND